MENSFTMSGDPIKLEQFKDWWLVKVRNYTVFQSKSKKAAKSFLRANSLFPSQGASIGFENVHQRIGTTMRKINIYP